MLSLKFHPSKTCQIPRISARRTLTKSRALQTTLKVLGETGIILTSLAPNSSLQEALEIRAMTQTSLRARVSCLETLKQPFSSLRTQARITSEIRKNFASYARAHISVFRDLLIKTPLKSLKSLFKREKLRIYLLNRFV